MRLASGIVRNRAQASRLSVELNPKRQFQAPRKALKTFDAAGSCQACPGDIRTGVHTRFRLTDSAFQETL